MTSVLVLQLDGKLPNLALLRIIAHHRGLGHQVQLRQAGNFRAVEPHLGDPAWDRVFASLIFERTRPLAARVRDLYPRVVLGGTGWEVASALESVGIPSRGPLDFTDYPRWTASIGFTQRGCRLRCSFCVVPRKEGAIREEQTIGELWRGDPWPRHLYLLDNDFFGQPHWDRRVQEMQAGQFKVCFSQGINARMLTDETAAAIGSVDYRADGMTAKRIYTAWDNQKDERRLFAGLEALVRHGVKPSHIMVYMLIGYWPGETHADREYRRQQLREFGCVPYPMTYTRTPELMGFQRWVIGAYDKNVSWKDWCSARYRPERLRFYNQTNSFDFGIS